ncbi:MAG: hypothetical protein Q7J15_06140 [Candidatus Desulfaltia sp.]|nr:hypothetical protein [Candidatus Desulfaltia sp.]
MTGAVGQKRVSVSFLIETIMSLPPIKEQDQIIREIQGRISTIDVVDIMIDLSLKHADRLRQSILKKAFSGKLICSVKDYELDTPLELPLVVEAAAAYGTKR